MKRHSRGFTVIELLIVVVIIGVLTAIVIGQLGLARQRARDAQRISDVHEIQIALEAHFEASPMLSQSYPDSLDPLVTEGYLPSMPADPMTHTKYAYKPVNEVGGTLVKSYCLGATLENTMHQAIQSSATCDSGDSTNNYKVSR